MNYEDSWAWPDIPVEPVDRDEIETLYSLGHYDGVGTGLIRWEGRIWWADRFEIRDRRYWIIEITPEHAERLLKRSREWESLFSSAMSWTPDGLRVPDFEGPYCTNLPFKGGSEEEYQRRRKFYQEWNRENSLESPPKDAKVVGYFEGWRKS